MSNFFWILENRTKFSSLKTILNSPFRHTFQNRCVVSLIEFCSIRNSSAKNNLWRKVNRKYFTIVANVLWWRQSMTCSKIYHLRRPSHETRIETHADLKFNSIQFIFIRRNTIHKNKMYSTRPKKSRTYLTPKITKLFKFADIWSSVRPELNKKLFTWKIWKT